MTEVPRINGDARAAIEYLAGIAPDLRAAAIIGLDGEIVVSLRRAGAELVSQRCDDDLGLVADEIFVEAQAERGARDGGARHVEIASTSAEVFCVRQGRLTAVVVTGRLVLPSLMLYDMQEVLRQLQEPSS